jgi:hypothetical protein
MATRQINDGVDVTSAGTAVPLSAAQLTAGWVFVQAKAANTGKIHVGSSAVSATSKQVELSPTDGYTFPTSSVPNIYDLAEIFIDSDTDGDGVWVGYGVV